MPAMVIFHLLLLFLLRVASSSCSLVVLILLPLLLLPIEIEMRKGRSLAPCSSGGEGVLLRWWVVVVLRSGTSKEK
ncbi:hypothetical protein V6Z12_A05G292200 [Gossypium hirsutum]